jgi:hypothetical protein
MNIYFINKDQLSNNSDESDQCSIVSGLTNLYLDRTYSKNNISTTELKYSNSSYNNLDTSKNYNFKKSQVKSNDDIDDNQFSFYQDTNFSYHDCNRTLHTSAYERDEKNSSSLKILKLFQ